MKAPVLFLDEPTKPASTRTDGLVDSSWSVMWAQSVRKSPDALMP